MLMQGIMCQSSENAALPSSNVVGSHRAIMKNMGSPHDSVYYNNRGASQQSAIRPTATQIPSSGVSSGQLYTQHNPSSFSGLGSAQPTCLLPSPPPGLTQSAVGSSSSIDADILSQQNCQRETQQYDQNFPIHELVNGLAQLNLSLAAANSYQHLQRGGIKSSVSPHSQHHQASAIYSSPQHMSSRAPLPGNFFPAASHFNSCKSSAPSSSPLTTNKTFAFATPVSYSQGISSPTAQPNPNLLADISQSHSEDLESDSDEDTTLTHPNKFPVEIEHHDNRFCSYKRQPTRSGNKLKQRQVTVYDPMSLQPGSDIQHIRYYQKDLVRVCRCGRYPQMDGALTHGRSNDCDGYEIHYNQKCKWKAYDDFKTGKRVLIRLCKCYKPML